MSTLAWKPFILKRVITGADAAAANAEQVSADAFVRHELGLSQDFCDSIGRANVLSGPADTRWACDSIGGSEATDEFTLADLEPGVSVIGGRTTSGYWGYGVVMSWEPGKYFTYDGSQAGSLLWTNLLLLRGPIADAARVRYQERYRPREEGEDSPTVPLQRTDSGTSYGFTGQPDTAFWIRSGVEPFLFVTSRQYHSYGVVSDYTRTQIAHELRDLRAALAAPEEMTADQLRACRHQEAVTAAELAALA